MGAELTVDAVSDYEEIKEQVLEKVRHRPQQATEGEEAEDARVVPSASEEGSPDEVLTELRRIRELLEDGIV